MDDHPIFRKGLKHVVLQLDDIGSIVEAETGLAALAVLENSGVDIVLLDLAMPGMDGLKLLESIRERDLSPLVIIVTSYDDKAYLDRAFELGARGYVLKDDATSDVVACLDAVWGGGIYISPSLGRNKTILPSAADGGEALIAKLTVAEREVLARVAEFKTSKEVARDLDISHRTVQNHRANICTKLGLKGSHQLVNFASVNSHLIFSTT